MSFHDMGPLRVSRIARRERNSSTSPTFFRETCIKPILDDSCHYHIFGLPSYDSTTPSCDQTSMTMSSSSFDSSSCHSEKMASVGLPSDYPLHRKSTACTIVTVEEELEDFDMFYDDSVCHRSLSSLPERSTTISDVRSMPPESPKRRTSPLQSKLGVMALHHRRGHPGSGFESMHSTVSTTTTTTTMASKKPLRMPRSRHHRPERNQAMGAKDFYEAVLTDLFENISVKEFQY
jgi:hypothetical protein